MMGTFSCRARERALWVLCHALVALTVGAWIFLSATRVRAQTIPVPTRVTEAVDPAKLVTLRGNSHPLARPENDRGLAPDDLPMARMLLVLQRSPDQEAELRHLLDEQQVKSSPNFHKWLTPEEFGERFGPGHADVQAVTDWLGSEGFEVGKVGPGRTVIEFSGTAGLVRDAFHTEIHQYEVKGEKHWANATDPQIPAALAPVIAGIASLNNFPRKPLHRVLGAFRRSKATGEVKPLFTFPLQGLTFYGIGPADFATIYNVLPLWNAGTDGTGETIAIVGDSNINIQDVRDFRIMFGLPAKDPQIILDGPDPGLGGSETEADLDVQWSGAVAKNATIDLVVSQNTETTAGVDLSALYIVDNNLAPVLSVSFGECEAFLPASVSAFYNMIYEQAAAQGITVTVASGDAGSATCDQGNPAGAAQNGLSVSGLASTPFNVALGGTDFNDFNALTTYWSPGNNAVSGQSAKSYIPEIPWNSSCARSGSLTGCVSLDAFGLDLTGGGGGPSTLYSKPAWQTGPGVPSVAADPHRDIPDVSLFASIGAVASSNGQVQPGSLSFYIICEMDANQSQGGNPASCDLNAPYLDFLGLGGTSASAPAFAGIMALVNQKTGERQGNANYILYKLAAQPGMSCTSDSTAVTKTSCTFYDITTSNNSVACQGGSPNCSNTSAGLGVLVNPANPTQPAWSSNAGYDMAAGLGSVNAANLVKNWSSVTFAPTTTALALSTSPATNPITLAHGQPVNVNITVAPKSGTATPSGDVSLIAQTNGNPASTTTGVGTFTLASGSVTGATTNMLPGGSYNVTAHYAGDGNFGASDSAPVQVTVTKENSQPTISLISIDPFSGAVTNPNVTTAVYGSSLFMLRVDLTNSSGQKCSLNTVACATGNVTLTNNGQPIDQGTYALNSQGFAEDQTMLIQPSSQLPAGTDNVAANYSGDMSYNPSSATAPIIITSAPTITQFPIPNTSPVIVGVPVVLSTTVSSNSFGVQPTGTVTFLANGSPLTGTETLVPASFCGLGPACVQANLTTTFSSPGDLTTMADYSGDSNYAPSNSFSAGISVRYADSMTISSNPSPANVLPGSSVTLTALVDTTNKGPAPTGTITFCCDPGLANGTLTVTPTTDGSGNAALQATEVYTPSLTAYMTANYGGDSNYINVSSSQILVTLLTPDFSLAANPTTLNITPGQTGSAVITATALYNFSGPISFQCPVPLNISEATCAVSPASVTTSTSGTTTLTITTTAPSTTYLIRPNWFINGTGVVLIGLLLLITAMAKRRLKLGYGVLLAGMLAVILLACGGGGGGGGGGIHDPGTLAGNYTVTVTATSPTASSALTHTINVNVTVQ